MPDEHGRLTPHDLVFGLGRKATKDELEELINRPQGFGVDIETARAEAKEYLQSLRDKREASMTASLSTLAHSQISTLITLP